MRSRLHRLPITLTRTHLLVDIGPRRHDPIESPIRIIHQHVPYGPQNIRKRVFSGLYQSEVGFLDFASTELGTELASLEAVSCEEERAGCVLVRLGLV